VLNFTTSGSAAKAVEEIKTIREDLIVKQESNTSKLTNYNYNEKLVLRRKMQMQTQQGTPLSNPKTRNEISVSSAHSGNSTKKWSYHVNLW